MSEQEVLAIMKALVAWPKWYEVGINVVAYGGTWIWQIF